MVCLLRRAYTLYCAYMSLHVNVCFLLLTLAYMSNATCMLVCNAHAFAHVACMRARVDPMRVENACGVVSCACACYAVRVDAACPAALHCCLQ